VKLSWHGWKFARKMWSQGSPGELWSSISIFIQPAELYWGSLRCPGIRNCLGNFLGMSGAWLTYRHTQTNTVWPAVLLAQPEHLSCGYTYGSAAHRWSPNSERLRRISGTAARRGRCRSWRRVFVHRLHSHKTCRTAAVKTEKDTTPYAIVFAKCLKHAGLCV